MNNKSPKKVPRVSDEKEGWEDALAALHGARLLLVEDNEICRQVAQAMLERVGSKVDLAQDGLEAVEAAAEKQAASKKD